MRRGGRVPSGVQPGEGRSEAAEGPELEGAGHMSSPERSPHCSGAAVTSGLSAPGKFSHWAVCLEPSPRSFCLFVFSFFCPIYLFIFPCSILDTS